MPCLNLTYAVYQILSCCACHCGIKCWRVVRAIEVYQILACCACHCSIKFWRVVRAIAVYQILALLCVPLQNIAATPRVVYGAYVQVPNCLNCC